MLGRWRNNARQSSAVTPPPFGSETWKEGFRAPSYTDILAFEEHAPKNPSGLPIFSPREPVAYHPTEMVAAAAAQASFLRGVRLVLPHSFTLDQASLREVLSTADREIDRLSEGCSATGIGHEWGLVYRAFQPALLRHPQHPIVPRGFVLAASVDSIKNPTPPNAAQLAGTDEGFKTYDGEETPFRLTDLSRKQFVAGQSPEWSEPVLWYVDMDVRAA